MTTAARRATSSAIEVRCPRATTCRCAARRLRPQRRERRWRASANELLDDQRSVGVSAGKTCTRWPSQKGIRHYRWYRREDTPFSLNSRTLCHDPTEYSSPRPGTSGHGPSTREDHDTSDSTHLQNYRWRFTTAPPPWTGWYRSKSGDPITSELPLQRKDGSTSSTLRQVDLRRGRAVAARLTRRRLFDLSPRGAQTRRCGASQQYGVPQLASSKRWTHRRRLQRSWKGSGAVSNCPAVVQLPTARGHFKAGLASAEALVGARPGEEGGHRHPAALRGCGSAP